MSSPYDSKPVPRANPESQPYWAACAEGRLALQRCEDCGKHQFYPRIMCSHCGSRSLAWADAAGRGTVKTFTIVRRAVSAAFEPDVPYVVALVELTEGPTMMTNIVQTDPEQVRIGMAVQVCFEPRGDTQVPQFRPLG